METFTFAGSSLLRSGSYDEASQELRLTFKSGKTWIYSGVPPDEAAALRSASSSGSYFLNSMKGNYAERPL